MAASTEKRASRDEHVDQVLEPDADHKDLPQSSAAEDYTGVALKTDPEEIRLVRKLDLRIMVPIHAFSAIPGDGNWWWLTVYPCHSPPSASCTSSTMSTATPLPRPA